MSFDPKATEMKYTVRTKGGHEITLKNLDFQVIDGVNPKYEWTTFSPDKVIVVAILEFTNDPPMNGRELVKGILRGLKSIER